MILKLKTTLKATAKIAAVIIVLAAAVALVIATIALLTQQLYSNYNFSSKL